MLLFGQRTVVLATSKALTGRFLEFGFVKLKYRTLEARVKWFILDTKISVEYPSLKTKFEQER